MILALAGACGGEDRSWSEANKKSLTEEIVKLGGTPELAQCVIDDLRTKFPDKVPKDEATIASATGESYQKCGTPFAPEARKKFGEGLQAQGADAAMAQCITDALAKAFPTVLPPITDERRLQVEGDAADACGFPFGPEARMTFAKALESQGADAAMAQCYTDEYAKVFPTALPPASDQRLAEVEEKTGDVCGVPFGPVGRATFAEGLQEGEDGVDAATAQCIVDHLAKVFPTAIPPQSDPRRDQVFDDASEQCVGG